MDQITFSRPPNWEYLMYFLAPRSTKGASKQRRDLINAEIAVLRDLLPLPEATRQRLSQLQIMSLACVYIRKCNFFSRLFGDGKSTGRIDCEFSQAMTGFLLATSRDGKLLYISENVTEYLGHSMVDMMTQGDSIYDIIDKRDHQLVQRQLMQDNVTIDGGTGLDGLPRNERSFFCRMNVARSFRRQAGFGDHKMMYVNGHFVTPSIRDHYGNQPVFLALCTPLITPDVKETTIQNSTQTFYSVHGLDMKYSELGHIGQYHLGYTEGEIVDKSWYELLHPEDILEAKEKHVQLIKSSHEMGCVLTARLQHKAGHWVWMNIVMHIRQPFICDNDEPTIVCINQVINESEAQQFKIQSQMYSSQIARSPEFLGSRDANVPHTITQVPVERGSYPGQGCTAGQRSREDVTYQVNFVAAGRQVMSPRSEQLQGVGSGQSNSGIFTDSGSEYSNSSSSEADTKQAIRADIINRLKRKMSESIANCKPKKIQRFNDNKGPTSSGSDMVGVRPAVLVSDVSSLNGVGGGGLAVGNGPVQVLAAASQDAPLYQQLTLKKELVLHQPDSLANIESTVPLYRAAAVKPPTPLTPDSLTSDLTADFQTDLLQVDVVDSAVVPPSSVLTPDASPISVGADEMSNSPPPHVDPSLEYSAQLATLDDLCFFEENNPSKAAKLPVILQLPNTANKHLPVIDAVSLESMLCGLTDDSSRVQALGDVAGLSPSSPSLSEQQQQQNPAQQQQQQQQQQQPKLSENDEQLLNQVTNVLIEMVQQAADGNLDLSQLMMASQQQQQAGNSLPPATSTTNTSTSVPSVKINDSLAELDGLTQLSSAAAITDEMNFTLDDISQLTQLDIATPSFGDCDLTSSLLAQNL